MRIFSILRSEREREREESGRRKRRKEAR